LGFQTLSFAQSREERREASLDTEPGASVPATDFISDRLYFVVSAAAILWITYSTVTDFARLRGWSTSVPLSTAT
jgi:hypothetical protein